MSDRNFSNSSPSATPEENVRDFVSFCKRQLDVFGRDLPWEDISWPGTGCCFGKLSVMSIRGAAYRIYATKNPLNIDFMDFAKAYMRYQYAKNPLKSSTSARLGMLRLVEAALIRRTQSAHIFLLSRVVLDEIINMCAELKYSNSTIISFAAFLNELAAFLNAHRLTSNDIGDWKAPAFKHDTRNLLIGKEWDDYRKSKLVDPEVVQALMSIFRGDPEKLTSLDIYVTSIAALLMCQPARINEISYLQVGCLRAERDTEGDTYHFLAGYESNKGYGRNKKGIPAAMVSVAAAAIDRLAKLSYDGRRLAEHIENTPEKFYRHERCPKVMEDELLSPLQACDALGLSRTSPNTTFKNWLIAHNSYNETILGFSLTNLWKIVMVNQPILPDERGLLWQSKEKQIRAKDSLFCMTWGAFSERVGTSPVILQVANAESIGGVLTYSDSSKRLSIFERHGLTKQNGDPLSANSHQFRHWINTLLQKKGASEEVIAMWSGRKNINQNRVYNQMMDEEKFSRSVEAIFPVSASIKQVAPRMPRSIEEFKRIQKDHAGTIQHTEFGFCVHDYAATPCQLYSDCGNCAEHFCEKGNKVKTKAIKDKLAYVEGELAAAAQELSEGTYGADNWYKYHQGITERLRQLVSILDDPQVNQGALIWLKGGVYSIHGSRAALVAAEEPHKQVPENTSNGEKYGESV